MRATKQRMSPWLRSAFRPGRPWRAGLGRRLRLFLRARIADCGLRRLALCALLGAALAMLQGCGFLEQLQAAETIHSQQKLRPAVTPAANISVLAPLAPLEPTPTARAEKPAPAAAAADSEKGRPGNPETWGEAGKMGVGREFDAIYFTGANAELDVVAKGRLDSYAEWLRTHPQVWLTLVGHADGNNTAEFNYNLGIARALAVADYLEGHGLEGRRFFSLSYGSERPAAPGSGPEADALNNRVEVLGFVAPLGQDAPDPAPAGADAPEPEPRPEEPRGQELSH